MSLHTLNNEVHHENTGDASFFTILRQKIVDSGLNASATGSFNIHMALDHIWREYNHLAFDNGQTGSMISPFDAGLRPTGMGILPGGIVATGNNLVMIDGNNLTTIAGDNLITIA